MASQIVDENPARPVNTPDATQQTPEQLSATLTHAFGEPVVEVLDLLDAAVKRLYQFSSLLGAIEKARFQPDAQRLAALGRYLGDETANWIDVEREKY